jgi:hypothetical protein
MATEFQKKVWSEIDKIPYGSTMTYKEIAIKIGSLMHLGQLQMLAVKILYQFKDPVTELYVQMVVLVVTAPLEALR